MRFAFTTLAVSVALVAGCSNQGIPTMNHYSQSQLIAQQTQAPVAKKVPHSMTIHGDTRIDDYYWMRDDERQDPEILQHLEEPATVSPERPTAENKETQPTRVLCMNRLSYRPCFQISPSSNSSMPTIIG